MQIFIQKLAQFVNKTVSLHQITSAGYLKRAWIVATSERRFREFSWNQKKIAVTLHRQSEQTTSER